MHKKPDQISAEDRALIDAAVAEGRVRVMPAGQRTVTAIGELVFNPKANRLVAVDKKKAQERLRYWTQTDLRRIV